MTYYLPYIGIDQDSLKTGIGNDLLDSVIPAPPGYVGFWPGRNVDQVGIVHDLTSNANHLLYTFGNSDAVAYAAPGYFSSGAAAGGGNPPTSAGFEVNVSAFAPNVDNGDSFFISAGFNVASLLTGPVTIMGNAGDLNNLGFAVYWENDNTVQTYTRSSAGGFGRGKSATVTANADHRLTIFVDGVGKRMTCWYDGKIITNEYDLTATGTGLYYTANSPWWFGGGGAPIRDKQTQAIKWKDIHILWNRSGENNFLSPTYLENKLMREPGVMLTKLDLIR